MILDKKALWNQDINFPDNLINFKSVEQSFFGESIKRKAGNQSKLPVFLYYETRDDQNYLQSHYYIASGESNRAIDGSEGGRDLLLPDLSSHNVDEHTRGTILNAFCKIDFLLDVLICIEMGAYENKIKSKDMLSLLRDPEKLFSTTSRKISYLAGKGYLSDDTQSLLLRAKKIRNSLAHDYLPNLKSLDQREVEKWGGWNILIEAIYNSAWFYLLKDFSLRQTAVLGWVKNE